MTLLEQIAQGENVALEFKEARPKDSLKFVKTAVAFANGRGGRLLFGVENETGRIVGIPREKVAAEMDAIREAICNAVFHRDYLAPSCVYVALYDDRLEVISPGGLVREMTVEDARNGFSKIRNHAIGAALEYMGEVEGWGGGVSRYFESCEKMNLPPPMVVEETSVLKVTFFRAGKKDANAKKSKEKSKEKILAALTLHPDWTMADLVREVGLSRSGIERNLRQLKADGLLVRSGADNGGVWQVVRS